MSVSIHVCVSPYIMVCFSVCVCVCVCVVCVCVCVWCVDFSLSLCNVWYLCTFGIDGCVLIYDVRVSADFCGMCKKIKLT